jgi:parallel beta-helix repeat protein
LTSVVVLSAGAVLIAALTTVGIQGFALQRQRFPPRSASQAAAIYPGDDIQARVTAAPAGTAFTLKAGIHRLHSIQPKDGNSFTGEAGTVLSGARLLTTFTRSDRYWVAHGQTQQGQRHGNCQPGYPRCSFPEQLFIDDVPLRTVGSLGEVTAGAWYFDYDKDQIFFADDPAGHRVETSVTTTAFANSANNVTITGLVVEKYANLAQNGAITSENRSGWVITKTEARWNHGVGIRIGSGSKVTGSFIHHNGETGLIGAGTDLLVENNEISFNNTAHFDPSWEGGGTKFILTDRLIVRGNFVHHNGGPGLWTDLDNINTLYENNTCEDNERMGIIHEISYAAVIRNNIVRRNGFGFSDWAWGAGILIAASPNVEVYGNTVEGNADGIAAVQQNRGSGAHGVHQVSNLWVHDNVIGMTGGWTGLVQDVDDTSYFTSRNNRFERNRYQLGSGAVFFTWMNGDRSESEWRSYGQDGSGTFSR